MKHVDLATTAIALATLCVSSTTAAANAYVDGHQAWAQFKAAEAVVYPGPYKDGWEYWVGQRSKHPETCEQRGVYESPFWLAGCKYARSVLDPIDARRMSETAFRVGFNDGAAGRYNPAYVQESMPQQTVVVHDDPDAPADDVCMRAQNVIQRKALADARHKYHADSSSIEYSYTGGRYTGNGIYHCQYQVNAHVQDSYDGNSTVSADVTAYQLWSVEYFPPSGFMVLNISPHVEAAPEKVDSTPDVALADWHPGLKRYYLLSFCIGRRGAAKPEACDTEQTPYTSKQMCEKMGHDKYEAPGSFKTPYVGLSQCTAVDAR